MSIWFAPPALEALNGMLDNTLCRTLGMEIIGVDDDSMTARMPVEPRTHQPFGLLHGGATAALAESVASTAANCVIDTRQQMAVGLELNCNHLRARTEGWVHATARALHLGRRTQVWNIEMVDDDGKAVAAARLTVAVIERRQQGSPST